MSIKTINAENVHLREPFGYAGTAKKPLTKPVHATAYKRDGAIIIATTVGDSPAEFRKGDKIRVTYTPVEDKTEGLRWCRSCDEDHLRIIGTDARATATCPNRRKAQSKERRTTGRPSNAQRISRAQQDRLDDINNRLNKILDRTPASQERQVASMIKARIDMWGSEQHPSVAALCTEHGLTVEEGVALVTEQFAPVVPEVAEEAAAEEVAS